MKLLRLIEQSVYYAVMDCLTINIADETLTTNDNYYKIYKSRYNNWSVTGNVVVKKNNEVVSSGITLDYVNGKVIFASANTSTDVIKLTYSPCSVNLVQAYPDDPTSIKLPTVSIEHSETEERGYEIGSSSRKEINMWFFIDIFAQRSGQRSDIVDTIKEYFDMDIPVINYNNGFPTNSDGSKNNNFDIFIQTIGYLQTDSISVSTSRSLDNGNVEQYVATLPVLLTYYR